VHLKPLCERKSTLHRDVGRQAARSSRTKIFG
jgi:hypothetical protein